MTTPVIIGTIVTAKAIQFMMVGLFISKGTSVFKKKEAIQSWSVTQYLEELKSKKQ